MQQLPLVANQPVARIPPARPTRRNWYVVLIFCFFAAIIPETIATTSTSVAKSLTHPSDLLFVILFYGPADLLIREALMRQRLGWVSLILLGVAFGFINEGVVAGTWYTVRPNGYAYIGQINVAWAAALTVFHIFLSVIAPIAFVETLFPSRAGQPLLRRRGIIISAVIFLLVSALFLFAASERPYRIAVFALALILALVALRLPAARPRLRIGRPAPGLWRLRWAGFFAMLGYFALIYLLPPLTMRLAWRQTLASQVVDIAIFALFAALLLRTGRRWTARAVWSLRQTLALLSGILAFPILLTLLPFFWPTLEYLATVPLFVLLIALNLRLRRRERTSHNARLPADWRGNADDATNTLARPELY